MNPRASIPTTLSTFPRPYRTTIRSMADEKPSSSASSGVMSLKTMPSCGKSGTSRMSARSRWSVSNPAPRVPGSRPCSVTGRLRSAPAALGLALGALLSVAGGRRRPRPRRPGARAGRPGLTAARDRRRRLELLVLDELRLALGRGDRPEAGAGGADLGLRLDHLVPGLALLQQ